MALRLLDVGLLDSLTQVNNRKFESRWFGQRDLKCISVHTGEFIFSLIPNIKYAPVALKLVENKPFMVSLAKLLCRVQRSLFKVLFFNLVERLIKFAGSE